MCKQHFFYLARSDLLASAVDQLLNAAGEREIAVLIEKALVASAEPSIGKRAGIGFRVVLIALDHVRSLCLYFVQLTDFKLIALVIHDDHADAGSGPYRSWLAGLLGQRF